MTPFFLLMSLGVPELVVIAVVGLLLFGRRLPEVGRSVGKSFYEFKRGLGGMQDEMTEMRQLSREIRTDPPPAEPGPESTDDEKNGEGP